MTLRQRYISPDQCSPASDLSATTCDDGGGEGGDGGGSGVDDAAAASAAQALATKAAADALAASQAEAAAVAAAKAEEDAAAAAAAAAAEEEAKVKAAKDADDTVEGLKARLAALEKDNKESSTSVSELESRAQKRSAAMTDRLLTQARVKEEYREYAPDVDPFTKEGQAELEKWAQDRPGLCEPATHTPPPPQTLPDQFKDKPGAHFLDPATISSIPDRALEFARKMEGL